jgi:NADPH:quinone reductase-like Zn-dependent oxidoreductase
MATMRAVVLDEPGPVDNLHLRDLPIPQLRPGWVRIAVRAFGLNRSELHLRLGLAEGVRLPVVPGIEAVGIVDAAPGSDLGPGQQVAALMGGMGRAYDGGYAEYTLVPRSQVVPFRSELPWPVLGAVPETLQTAHGSLTTGLDLQAGQTLLIRGGTSALGFATTALAKDLGATVLATTRGRDRLDILAEHGTTTLPDTLAATRIHGTVCFAGMLSNEWTVTDFYPIDYLPRGVRLSAYGGDAADLPAAVLQRALDRIAEGTFGLGPVRTYQLESIRDAHRALEDNTGSGKIVVVTGSGARQ